MTAAHELRQHALEQTIRYYAEQQTAEAQAAADRIATGFAELHDEREGWRTTIKEMGAELTAEMERAEKAEAERDAARAEVAELTQQRDQARRNVEQLHRAVHLDGHGAVCAHCTSLVDEGVDFPCRTLSALGMGADGAWPVLAVPVPAGDTSHDEATGVYPPPSERDLCWKPVTAEDGYVENCGLWEGHRPPCLLVCGDCREGRCHIPVRPPRPGVGDPDCGCARHADSLRAYHLGDDDAAPAPVVAHAGQDETRGAM